MIAALAWALVGFAGGTILMAIAAVSGNLTRDEEHAEHTRRLVARIHHLENELQDYREWWNR